MYSLEYYYIRLFKLIFNDDIFLSFFEGPYTVKLQQIYSLLCSFYQVPNEMLIIEQDIFVGT